MTTRALIAILVVVSIAVGAAFYRKQIKLVSKFIESSSVTPPAATLSSPLSSRRRSGLRFDGHDAPNILPEFGFEDGSGRRLTLADFKNKVVLLNIWATWCVPCRNEVATLDRLQAALPAHDFQVVTLSVDQGVSEIETLFKKLGFTKLQVYIDAELRAIADLGLFGIPTSLLIDRDGREIGRVFGPEAWDNEEIVETIRSYLNAPTVVEASLE